MKQITISRAADSWQSIGLIALYEGLETFIDQDEECAEECLDDMKLSSHHLHFNYFPSGRDGLHQFLCEYVQQLMNQVPLLPIELRILGRNETFAKGEDGFLPVRMPVSLDKEDMEYIQQETDHAGNKKVYLKSPTKNVDITMMRNFIGIRKDWEYLRDKRKDIVDQFMQQIELTQEAKNQKTCSLCNSKTTSKLTYQMNQSRNPFMSQHHNTKVRGYFGSVNKGNMCAVCHFLNVLSSLYVQAHPYFVSHHELTHLLIPETNDLYSLRKIINKMQKSLEDLHSANISHYRTNIPSIGQRTLYPALFALYYWMGNEAALTKIGQKSLSESEQRSLHKWVVPRFKKGQNVIFMHFSEIEAGDVQFKLVKELYYGQNRDKKGNILDQFILRLRFQDPVLMDKLTESLWYLDWRRMKESLFVIFKRKLQNREPYLNWSFISSFFHAYLEYLLLEVEKVVSNQAHDDLKKLASVIGNNCVLIEDGKVQVDIGLLTKFHNATSVETFQRVLAELGFTIMKKDAAATKRMNQKDEERFHIGPERLERIMEDMSDEKRFRRLRDILMIYVSSYAHQRYASASKNLSEGGEA